MEEYIDFLNALIDKAEIDNCHVCSMKQSFLEACIEMD